MLLGRGAQPQIESALADRGGKRPQQIPRKRFHRFSCCLPVPYLSEGGSSASDLVGRQRRARVSQHKGRAVRLNAGASSVRDGAATILVLGSTR